MQRPMMHPVFRAEDVTPVKKKTPKWKTFFKDTVLGFIKKIFKSLLSSPVKIGGRRADTPDKPPLARRLVKGIAYRALFLPVLLVLATSTLVFTGTHPSMVYSATDPNSFGIYSESVTFQSEDGTHLDGWIAPVIDAKVIIEKRDQALRRKSPAVVLVHDFGQPPQTMLPLFEPLHQDGLVVIAMGLRGCTSSTLQVSGQTFGLHEALDVKAACQLLRDQPFVDGSRIAVVGVGSGATAAVLAAKNDPQIRATVLIDPPGTADEVLRLHVGPNKPLLQRMQPLCKWTFQLGYRVDAAEMEIDRFPEVTKFRPSLTLQSAGEAKFLSKPATIEVIRTFLCDNLRLTPVKGRPSGAANKR